MSDTARQRGDGWRLNLLSALAVAAPFTIKFLAGSWVELNLQLLIGAALVIVVILTVTGLAAQRWRPDWVDIVAYCWLAAVWFSALASDDIGIGLSGASRFSVAILLVPATRSVVRSQSDARRLLLAVLMGTVVGAVIGLAVWASDGRLDSPRVFFGEVTTLGSFNRLTRPWPHANGAAMVIGCTVATAAMIRARVPRAAVLSILTVALVLTVSRGGVAAGLAVGLVWVVLTRRRVEGFAVAGLVFLGLATLLASSAWTTRIDTLGDEAFYASSFDAPRSFVIDSSSVDVEVTITNYSTVTWQPDGPERVLISARWIGPDDKIWTEDWWRLPDALAPDQSVTTGLTLRPSVPLGDDYRVRWDLLIERTAYFGQFLGDAPVWSNVDVTVSDVAADEVVTYDFVPRLVEIGRRSGWELAWREFRGAPLLGVGPSQFGMGSSEERRANGQVAGAHAHSVLLEPLATWGLLGTIPFAVLGVGGFVRVVRLAWGRRDRLACVVAVGLVAIGVHGLVDWPLVQAATRIPVGLLIGLAWSPVSTWSPLRS